MTSAEAKAHTIIDTLLHDHCQSRPELWLLDALLHGIVSMRPVETLETWVASKMSPVVEAIVKQHLGGTPVWDMITWISDKFEINPFNVWAKVTHEWIVQRAEDLKTHLHL